MAISSYNAKLMHDSATTTVSEISSATWTKLLPVKTTPQLGGAPEQLETTTLDDNMQTFINGIQQTSQATFTANYSKTDYKALKALENTSQAFCVYFGNDGDGADGKFAFIGQLSVSVNETAVNSVVEMTITITVGSPINEISAS